MRIKLSNLHKPTPAKMAKIGTSLVSVSAFISASSFAMQHDTLGYVAIVIGVVGTFIVNMLD